MCGKSDNFEITRFFSRWCFSAAISFLSALGFGFVYWVGIAQKKVAELSTNSVTAIIFILCLVILISLSISIDLKRENVKLTKKLSSPNTAVERVKMDRSDRILL
jgi:nitric oxide reductase large subunit